MSQILSVADGMVSLQSLAQSVMVAEPNWCCCWIVWAGTRRTMYVRSRTSINLRLVCWNQTLCLIDVEARHAEADMALRHCHQLPPLTPVSTHQEICDRHLQDTILLEISPTSFKNWTPTLWSLNKNVINNLFETPLVPSVAVRVSSTKRMGLQ